MAKKETNWFETIENPALLNNAVKTSFYAAVASLKEAETAVFESKVPIIKAGYTITDQKGTVVKAGEKLLNEVFTFTLKELLDGESAEEYERPDGSYRLGVKVTLINGTVAEGMRLFECTLRKGENTRKTPHSNLLDELAAIPVARPDMTEEELRKICLDYMTLQTQFPYRFKETFRYEVESQKLPRTLKAETVYGGLPYVTRGAGNLYRIAEFYDPETGYLDLSGDIFEKIRFFGNACSGAASMAWGRVVTSAYLGYTMFMTRANGFLPVGPYRYSQPDVTKFIKSRIDPEGYNPKAICLENGEQTMFESYAQMKPADGMVCGSHVVMNAVTPVVVRNPDGTVNGEASYTATAEQVCYVNNTNHIRIAPDGTHYTAQGFVELRYSFKRLYDSGYIPFTFKEFSEPSAVEKGKARLSVEPALELSVLSTNYPVSDVFCKTGDRTYVFRNENFFCKDLRLGDLFPAEALTPETTVTCRLMNGELIAVDTRR